MFGRFLWLCAGRGLALEQRGRDPAPRIGGIDHLVDLEVGRRAERLAARIGGRDHLVEQGAPLGRIGDRLQLLAVAELDRALQPHAAELAGRPGEREGGGVERAAGHRLGAEPIGLAQHDGAERHGEVGAGHEQPRAVADQRGLLDLRPDHHAGRVAQEQDRDVEGVAELQEARGLVRAVRVDGAGEMRRIVGDDAERLALDAAEAPSPCRARRRGAAPAPSPRRTASRSRRARRRRAAGSRG